VYLYARAPLDSNIFSSCDSIKEFYIGDFYNIKDGVLYSKDRTSLIACINTGITSITVPNTVTTICESAFYGCDSLTSVTIPESVTDIEYYAFTNCESLEYVIINSSAENVRIDTYAFPDGCSVIYTK